MTLFLMTLLVLFSSSGSAAESNPEPVRLVSVSESHDKNAILTRDIDGTVVRIAVEDLKLLWADRESLRMEAEALKAVLAHERENADRLVTAAQELKVVAERLNGALAEERQRSRDLKTQRWFFLLAGVAVGSLF